MLAFREYPSVNYVDVSPHRGEHPLYFGKAEKKGASLPPLCKGCGCPVDTSAVGRSTDRAGRRDSLSISLGIKRPDELDVSLAPLMSKVIGNKPFDDDYGIIHCNEGIDLMPCNVELSGIESYLFTVMSRECIMRTYLLLVSRLETVLIVSFVPLVFRNPLTFKSSATSCIVFPSSYISYAERTNGAVSLLTTKR